MAENKMAEVARLLGVELDEEFKATSDGYEDDEAKLTTDGLLIKIYPRKHEKGKPDWIPCLAIEKLLTGKVKIKKLPYKPKEGEVYYSYYDEDFRIEPSKVNYNAGFYARLKCGMIFRTRKEAEKARDRIYKELTGKEWTQ